MKEYRNKGGSVVKRKKQCIGRLRKQAAALINKYLPDLNCRPKDIKPAKGSHRTNLELQFCRWTLCLHNHNREGSCMTWSILCCWQTLTDFTVLAARNGIRLDWPCGEIWARVTEADLDVLNKQK